MDSEFGGNVKHTDHDQLERTMEDQNTEKNPTTSENSQRESDSMLRVVSSPNPIQEAWEKYHGRLDDDEEIPPAPPVYIRGFVDGVDHEKGSERLIVESYGINENNCNQFTIKFTNGKKIIASAVTRGEWLCDLFVTKLI